MTGPNRPRPSRWTRNLALLVALASGTALSLCATANADTAQAPMHGPRAAASESNPRAVSALRFEPNVGQFDERVRYLARGRSYALFLSRDGATLALHRGNREGGARVLPAKASNDDDVAVVTMKVSGAAAVEPRGLAALPGTSNYFMGGDPRNFRSGVEAYARVRYESVLPGVDIEYHGTEGRELEYDFLLAAGVSPRALEVEFDGVSRIELTADGHAVLHLPDGSELVKARPIAYQERAGQRVPVPVRYERRPRGLGFVLGAYDAGLPLVIDPVLTYCTYFGGSSFDEANAITVDAGGNSYIVGYTVSTLFPTVAPLQPAHGGGGDDAFVVKLNPTGSAIVYSTYLGGSGADIAYAVATDALGNAYVAGLTTSTNFPVVSAVQATLGGSQDAFVAKLNANGSALSYSTYLGGAQDDYAMGIAVSNTGAAYLAGTTFSANFPKAAPLQASLRGTFDAFAAQLSPLGSSLVYSTYVGGSGTEFGNAIALDTANNAYLVGSTTSADFPTVNARQPAHAGGNTDAFVSKLNAAGSGFVYATYLGGSGADQALGVAIAQGTAVVVGDTASSNFPLAFPAQAVPGGNNHTDAFITRFDPSGTALVYSTYLGGTGNDSAAAVATDPAAEAYVVGKTDSADFPVQSPIDGQNAYHGAVDAFLAVLTPPGSRFVYSSYLGGASEDRATGIAVSALTTYVVGNTRSSDFPKVTPIFNGLVGSQDAFVAELPSIASTAAPALGRGALALLAVLLLAVALLLLARRDRIAKRATDQLG
jgi:hypothetical protein